MAWPAGCWTTTVGVVGRRGSGLRCADRCSGAVEDCRLHVHRGSWLVVLERLDKHWVSRPGSSCNRRSRGSDRCDSSAQSNQGSTAPGAGGVPSRAAAGSTRTRTDGHLRRVGRERSSGHCKDRLTPWKRTSVRRPLTLLRRPINNKVQSVGKRCGILAPGQPAFEEPVNDLAEDVAWPCEEPSIELLAEIYYWFGLTWL